MLFGLFKKKEPSYIEKLGDNLINTNDDFEQEKRNRELGNESMRLSDEKLRIAEAKAKEREELHIRNAQKRTKTPSSMQRVDSEEGHIHTGDIQDRHSAVDVSDMRGVQFERHCKKLLESHGFSNIRGTRASGDQGVDILAERCGKTYAIQCKGYEKTVGNHAVMEAHAGKDFYKADVAVVMINNYFTPSAIELARRINVQLWDKDEVLEMGRIQIHNIYSGINDFLRSHVSINAIPPVIKALNGKEYAVDQFITNNPYEAEEFEKICFKKATLAFCESDNPVFYCIKWLETNNDRGFIAYYKLWQIPPREAENITNQFSDKYFVGILYSPHR